MGIKNIQALLESPAPLTLDDVRRGISFVRAFLTKMYPGKTIENIQNELNAQDEEDAGRKDSRDLMQYPWEKRKEIIHDMALELYVARYDWGYYPEATRNLDVKGVSLDFALDKRRDELEAHYTNPRHDRATTLKIIREKMRSGKAEKEEEEFFGLYHNKISGNWMGAVFGALEMLRSLGSEFQEIYDECIELKKKNSAHRDAMARRAQETGTTEGFIPFGDKTFAAMLRKDIGRADILIDRALALILTLLYPEDMAQKDVKKKRDRREIKKLLDREIF